MWLHPRSPTAGLVLLLLLSEPMESWSHAYHGPTHHLCISQDQGCSHPKPQPRIHLSTGKWIQHICGLWSISSSHPAHLFLHFPLQQHLGSDITFSCLVSLAWFRLEHFQSPHTSTPSPLLLGHPSFGLHLLFPCDDTSGVSQHLLLVLGIFPHG